MRTKEREREREREKERRERDRHTKHMEHKEREWIEKSTVWERIFPYLERTDARDTLRKVYTLQLFKGCSRLNRTKRRWLFTCCPQDFSFFLSFLSHCVCVTIPLRFMCCFVGIRGFFRGAQVTVVGTVPTDVLYYGVWERESMWECMKMCVRERMCVCVRERRENRE